MSDTRPFLRWAGSKKKLLPLLQPFWEESYDRYVEPFMGSACLYFALRPQKALLSDTNAELVEVFNLVRDCADLIYARLTRIPRTKAQYYKMRSKNPVRMTPVNRAVRFIYLNRNCFNGLYRTNNSGHFNVPFSSSRVAEYPTWDDFEAASKVLQNATVVDGDFEAILRDSIRSGDFVYMDPPYAVENRRVFKQYGPQTFGTADLERLRSLLCEVDKRGAHFVLSYAYCPEAVAAFNGWNSKIVQIQRNISGFVKHRRMDAELIVTNKSFPQ